MKTRIEYIAKAAGYNVEMHSCMPHPMALRVIKRFEKVNQTQFNPFDSCHVEQVSGYANFESFHWSVDRIFNRAGA